MAPTEPLRCTVVLPSLDHGRFLEAALHSVFRQPEAAEVFVMDGGSTDSTTDVLRRWDPRLTGWRSGPDGGQAEAINRGIAQGQAPYVAWLNADDLLLDGGLGLLARALQANPAAPFAYGRARIIDADGRALGSYRTCAFDRDRFARRCFICQPATLIRRDAWQRVGGLSEHMVMALDYDLWWRLAGRLGSPVFVDADVAVTRSHIDTKTLRRPWLHYREALQTVRRHYGRVPASWYLKMPYSIGSRWLASRLLLPPS